MVGNTTAPEYAVSSFLATYSVVSSALAAVVERII